MLSPSPQPPRGAAAGFRRLTVLLPVLGFAVLLSGCEHEEPVVRYTIPKPDAVYEANHVESDDVLRPNRPGPAPGGQSAADQQAIIGAIIPHGEKTWFFKLAGSQSALAPHVEAFIGFARTLRFTDGDDPTPEWTLPDTWTEEPGSGIRYATLRVPARPEPLEVTVTPLVSGEETGDEFSLANVNLWREQLGLPAVSLEEFRQSTFPLELEGATGRMVIISPRRPAAPMAGAAPAGPGAPAAGGAPASLKYDAPAEWKAGRTSSFRKASFAVTDGDRALDISVIDLPAEVNELLPNVNRWREQVGLSEVTRAELEKDVQTLDVDGLEGHYVRLHGRNESILGVMVVRGDKAWFIKLQGDTELAKQEQGRFEAFVKSIRFGR